MRRRRDARAAAIASPPSSATSASPSTSASATASASPSTAPSCAAALARAAHKRPVGDRGRSTRSSSGSRPRPSAPAASCDAEPDRRALPRGPARDRSRRLPPVRAAQQLDVERRKRSLRSRLRQVPSGSARNRELPSGSPDSSDPGSYPRKPEKRREVDVEDRRKAPRTDADEGSRSSADSPPPGVHPFDEIEWEIRDAVIGDPENPAFEQRGVEFPKTWSQNATNIVAQKYFRGQLGTPSARPPSSR